MREANGPADLKPTTSKATEGANAYKLQIKDWNGQNSFFFPKKNPQNPAKSCEPGQTVRERKTAGWAQSPSQRFNKSEADLQAAILGTGGIS